MIRFNKPFFTGNETVYINQAIDNGRLAGNGYFTKKCQDYFKDKLQNQLNLCTTSCTDALEMSALLCNISQR